MHKTRNYLFYRIVCEDTDLNIRDISQMIIWVLQDLHFNDTSKELLICMWKEEGHIQYSSSDGCYDYIM